MLSGVCIELASRGWQVSVAARDWTRLGSLAERSESGRVGPISTDYQKPAEFIADIRTATRAHEPVGLTIAWIHSGNDVAVQALIDLCRVQAGQPTFIHVLPSAMKPQHDNVLIPFDVAGIDYRRVYLGWLPTGTSTRWLTHEEICAGVLGVIEDAAPVHMIGRFEPSESRPP